MPIWNEAATLESMIARNRNTMGSHLGIEFLEIGNNFLIARMPVDHRTRQPYGIMHGGASCVLAETVASVAANYCIDTDKYFCVGSEINTSHIRPVASGWVIGTATPLHLGKTTQVWEIIITNDENQTVSVSRLRLAVLEKK